MSWSPPKSTIVGALCPHQPGIFVIMKNDGSNKIIRVLGQLGWSHGDMRTTSKLVIEDILKGKEFIISASDVIRVITTEDKYKSKIIAAKQKIDQITEKTGSDRDIVVDLYNSLPEDVFEFLSIFEYKISYDDVMLETSTTANLEIAKEYWLQLIRRHRETVFKELDELEAEAADDIEDIETIKQMFRDVPQDIDFSKFKTVREVCEFWPALLLPAPDEIKCVEYMFRSNYQIPPEIPDDSIDILKKLVDSVDDSEMLRQFAEEISHTEDIPDLAKSLIRARINAIESTTAV
jgi:hypothetical protein